MPIEPGPFSGSRRSVLPTFPGSPSSSMGSPAASSSCASREPRMRTAHASSTSPTWSFAAARSWRSPGRTDRARQLWPSSQRACSSRRSAWCIAPAEPPISARIRDATSSPSESTKRLLWGSAAISSVHAQPWSCLGSAASKLVTPAISPAASASAWGLPRLSSPSPTCWSSTSRLAGWTRNASSSSRRCFGPTRRSAERSSSPMICSLRLTSPTASSVRYRRRRRYMPRAALLGAAAVTFAGGAWAALSPRDAGLSLLLVALALVAAGFVWLESGPGSAKEVAVVAAGAALGARVGFAVGAVAALVSNFYLGQGIWTPWQMLAWGGCGVAGALTAGLIRRRWAFAALCFALGFAFSSAMDLWHWYSFWPHTWEALTIVYGRGVWFSAAHAIGNVVFAVAIGPELRRVLERYGRRLRVEIAWA